MKEYVLGPAVSEAQDELLTCLIEECSEIIKAATKLQRFGALKNELYDNPFDLAHEIGELNWIAKLLVDSGLIVDVNISIGYDDKRNQLRGYLVHA